METAMNYLPLLVSDSGGGDSMSQIKGDITGRTSKERYEPLILEL